MSEKENNANNSQESRTVQAGQDYFEQIGGNVYTGPVYMQGQAGQGAETIRPKVFHNLPHPDYGRFIGRESELQKLRELLSPKSRHFVITIDGIGGIGKSALALEIAHRYLHNYDQLDPEDRFDAIIWMSAKQTILTAEGISTRRRILHTLNDIYTAIAVALQREDITRVSAETQDEVVCQALTRQRTLLIVDNLETIDDEAVLDFLRELPDPTKAIVTTRHRIDVAYPVRLTGMPWEDGRQLILQETEKKEVELYEDSIRRLYDRTGGVPLAIVWSIAQMGFGYSVGAVLTRLGQPSGDIAKFCFEGAIERIKNKPAHRLLMVLSLCADSASREALGYATELPELDRDDGLVELEKLSLVNKKGDRFWLLPLTKQFASAELQQSPEKDALRERWNAYFQKWSEVYRGEFWKWTNYDWLRDEGENLLAITDWAIMTGHRDIAMGIIYATQRYLTLYHVDKWQTYATQLYQAVQELNDKHTQAWIGSRWLAPVLAHQGQTDKAKDLAEQSIALYCELQDLHGQCFAMNSLGRVLRVAGNYQAAETVLLQAESLAQNHQYDEGIVATRFELAKLDRDRDEWEQAKQYWEMIIAWLEEHEEGSEFDISSLMAAREQLGWAEFHRGNYQRAKVLVTDALTFFEQHGGKRPITMLHFRLAKIEAALGDYESALQYIREVLYWAGRLNMKRELKETQKLLKELQDEPKQSEEREDAESA
jgi:tetratricopeptide (TPR) repeat protein